MACHNPDLTPEQLALKVRPGRYYRTVRGPNFKMYLTVGVVNAVTGLCSTSDGWMSVSEIQRRGYQPVRWAGG